MTTCAAPLFDFAHAAHWRVQPAADARPVPASERGIVAPGHVGRPGECPVCTPGARGPRRPVVAPRPPALRPVVPTAPAAPYTPRTAPRKAATKPHRPAPPPLPPPVVAEPPEALPLAPTEPSPAAPGEVARLRGLVMNLSKNLRREQEQTATLVADIARMTTPGLSPNRRAWHPNHARIIVQAAAGLVFARMTTEPGRWATPNMLKFTTEALVIAAWRLAPEVFGLRGFEDQYPDARRVLVVLSRDHGPIARRLLLRSGPNLLRVTFAGWKLGRAGEENLAP